MIVDIETQFFDTYIAEEPEQKLGFSIICRQCDNVKNIVYTAGELFDGESINITVREIYCNHCGNKL